MISRSGIITKLLAIREAPTHVAAVRRSLEGTFDDEEVEDILVAAVVDANMRSYELQAQVLELLDRQVASEAPISGQLTLPGMAPS